MDRSDKINQTLRQIDAANKKRQDDIKKRKEEKELQLKIEANKISKIIAIIAFSALILSAISLIISIFAFYKQ